MDKTIEAIDNYIHFVDSEGLYNLNDDIEDMEEIVLEFEQHYPDMVDSVTTGMIQARIKEYNDGR